MEQLEIIRSSWFRPVTKRCSQRSEAKQNRNGSTKYDVGPTAMTLSVNYVRPENLISTL